MSKRLLVAFLVVGGVWVARDLGNRLTTQPDNGTAASGADDDTCNADHCDLVVDFRDDVPHEDLARLEQTLGIRLHAASSNVDADEIYTIRDDDKTSALTDREILAALRAMPDVEAASYNDIYTIPEAEQGLSADENDPSRAGFPNDPKFKFQWHMDQIHMKDAWKGAQGEGVIVAVLDTGIARVPDLEGTEFVKGWNFVDNTDNAADDHGHGTHVAGTIAQSTNNGVGVAGIAYRAKLMPIKVLSKYGSGSVSGIADGMRWAADHGAKVINMSLGGPVASSVLGNAVKYARNKGVVVVCAAGNDGRGKVSYPAAYPGAFAVAATQFDETTTFYSNWGKEIDIAAPGGNTRVDQNKDGMMDGVLQNTVVPGNTSQNDYLLFMGTSMASPHVAGVAALVMSQGVTDPDAVEKILIDSARKPQGRSDLLKEGPQNRYGAGLLDAGAAVKKARRTTGAGEVATASFAALLIGLLVRRRGAAAAVKLGAGGIAAMVIAAGGLWFVPELLPAGTHFTTVLSGPIWTSGNPILASSAIPIAAVLLLYGLRKLRPMLVGLTLGIGGSLLFHAFVRTFDVAWIPNAFDGAWLAVHGAITLGIAYLVARKE